MADLIKQLLTLNLQTFAEDGGEGKETDPAAKPEEDEKGTGADTKPEDKKEEPKTFTQEQLTAIASKESKAATAKVLKELGITDFDNAKEGMQQFKEWQDSQKTEADKAAERMTELETTASEKDGTIQTLQYENAALKADVNLDYLDDVVALAEKRVTDDVSIDDAMKAVMEQYPQFGKVKAEPETKETPHFLGGQHKSGSDKELDPFAAKLAKYKK